jgi:hypothetical protein
MIILVALRGVPEGGEAPLQEIKKFLVFFVLVVLVVLNS